jgi:hypothetical protein
MMTKSIQISVHITFLVFYPFVHAFFCHDRVEPSYFFFS